MILAVTATKNNSKLIKENKIITENGWDLSVNKKNMEHIETTMVVFHSL